MYCSLLLVQHNLTSYYSKIPFNDVKAKYWRFYSYLPRNLQQGLTVYTVDALFCCCVSKWKVLDTVKLIELCFNCVFNYSLCTCV